MNRNGPSEASGNSADILPLQGFNVSVEAFDGPIDLLLHLVKRRELPLDKISLVHVATQYIECLETLARLEFEIASEYLVIAATLLSLKASFLLGDDVEEVVVIRQEEDEVLDPHDQLLAQLRHAAHFRTTAHELGARHLLGVDVFEPAGIVIVTPPDEIPLKQHDPLLLGKAFQKLIERAKSQELPFIITLDALSIADRMMLLLDRLDAAGGTLNFEDLLLGEDAEGELEEPFDLGMLVSCFLALLELCKRSALLVKQESPFQAIVISRVALAASSAAQQSSSHAVER